LFARKNWMRSEVRVWDLLGERGRTNSLELRIIEKLERGSFSISFIMKFQSSFRKKQGAVGCGEGVNESFKMGCQDGGFFPSGEMAPFFAILATYHVVSSLQPNQRKLRDLVFEH